MRVVNVQEAKTHLSRLLEEAAAGADILIAKSGRPYVRLVPFRPEGAPRTLGGWEGSVWIADDFDDEDEAIVRLFHGAEPVRPRRARRRGTSRRRVPKKRT